MSRSPGTVSIASLRRSVRVLVLATSALVLAACSSRVESARAPRLVVLYAPCTVAKRALSPYSASVDFTPNLRHFADESVVFRRHMTEAEQSGPAFASIVSGTHADRHGVMRHPQVLPSELYLISEAFADAGYETWSWDGHPMAARELAYAQGCADEHVVRTRVAERGRMKASEAESFGANDERFGELLERLRREPDARAFVQVTFTVSHGPYTYYSTRDEIRAFRDRRAAAEIVLGDEELERWLSLYETNAFELVWDFENTAQRLGVTLEQRPRLARAVDLAYGTAIERLDAVFGRFLERIRAAGLDDESVIAFTADHGETAYRDNLLFPWTHGYQLAPESVEVPWLLRAPPELARPGAFENVTRSIDVFPTLAGLCGVELPPNAELEGVDLSPALLDRSRAPELAAWSHSTPLDPAQYAQLKDLERVRSIIPGPSPELIWTQVRHGDRVAKLRRFGAKHWGVELFDVAADPEQRRDLFDPANPEHAALETSLRAYKERILRGAERTREAGASRPEDALERLKELGYVR